MNQISNETKEHEREEKEWILKNINELIETQNHQQNNEIERNWFLSASVFLKEKQTSPIKMDYDFFIQNVVKIFLDTHLFAKCLKVRTLTLVPESFQIL